MKHKITFLLLILFIGTLFAYKTVEAQDTGSRKIEPPPADAAYARDHLIIRLKEGVSESHKTDLYDSFNLLTLKKLTVARTELVRISGMSVEEAIRILENNPHVEHVQPNYIYHLDAIPNDTRFFELWNMHNTGQEGGKVDADIDAVEAWDLNTGNPIVIGVVDSGVDTAHVDLWDNLWTNPDEIPDNRIDDDQNGHIDDIHGWDFVYGDNNPEDASGHGSNCSGIIAAVGNNGEGVTGVCWSAKIMAVRAFYGNKRSYTSIMVDALKYARIMGADIINASWSDSGYDPEIASQIDTCNLEGILFVASAGNYGVNTDEPENYHYPSCYDFDNIISVAATDRRDTIWIWSNYGDTTVDLGAPGVDILSTCYQTWPEDEYCKMTGTSQATAHVTGAAALLSMKPDSIPIIRWRLQNYQEQLPTLHVPANSTITDTLIIGNLGCDSLNGTVSANSWIDISNGSFNVSGYQVLTHLEVKDKIMNTVDSLPALSEECVSGGRLNLFRALLESIPADAIEVTFDAPNSDTFLVGNIHLSSNDQTGNAEIDIPLNLLVTGDYHPEEFVVVENPELRISVSNTGNLGHRDPVAGFYLAQQFNFLHDGSPIVGFISPDNDTLVGRYIYDDYYLFPATDLSVDTVLGLKTIVAEKDFWPVRINVPPADQYWPWWRVKEKLCIFYSEAPENKKEQYVALEYLKLFHDQPPAWWVDLTAPDSIPETYLGMALDINCLSDYGWAINSPGYDKSRRLAYLHGYPQYFMGIAQRDTCYQMDDGKFKCWPNPSTLSQPDLPYSMHLLRNDAFVYPQNGFRDDSLYKYMARAGYEIYGTGEAADYSVVTAGAKINAHSYPCTDTLGVAYVLAVSDDYLVEPGSTLVDMVMCGNVDRDTQVGLADVVYYIGYLFQGGTEPWLFMGDANGNGIVGLADVNYLIGYLFKNGPPPRCSYLR